MNTHEQYTTKRDKSTGKVLCYGLPDKGPEMRMPVRRVIGRALMVILLAVMLAGILLAVAAVIGRAMAEEDDQIYSVYAMVKAGDYVNVRLRPSKKSECLGYMELGDSAQTDGIRRGEWLHLVNLSLEETEGWIHSGYVVDEEPVIREGAQYRISASGRVACRKWMDGNRRAWAKRGATVKVYAIGGGWALTNRGYILEEFLEEAP